MEPGSEAIEKAVQDADRLVRTCGMVCAGCVVVIALGVLLAVTLPQVGLFLAGIGVTFGSIYGLALRRVLAARAALRSGPFRGVRAEGWCRPPDGCNYALFASPGDMPDAVLRLPLRREMRGAVDAWLAGRIEPAILGGVGLFNDEGLLGTGRILPGHLGRKRWMRRRKEPGRLVQRPPEDWLPPGGQ